MSRRSALNLCVAASLATFALAATAQTGPQNNTPRNAPAGTAAPAVGTTPSAGVTTGGTSGMTGAPLTSGSSGLSAPTTGTGSDMPRDMSGYKAARAACDSGPAADKDTCRTKLNTRYSSVNPKCQKMSGSALDNCLRGADRAQ